MCMCFSTVAINQLLFWVWNHVVFFFFKEITKLMVAQPGGEKSTHDATSSRVHQHWHPLSQVGYLKEHHVGSHKVHGECGGLGKRHFIRHFVDKLRRCANNFCPGVAVHKSHDSIPDLGKRWSAGRILGRVPFILFLLSLVSFTSNPSEFSPTASTIPEHSNPGTSGGFGGLSIVPWRTIRSRKFSPLRRGKCMKICLDIIF